MVVFTCNHCGSSLKKNKVEKHYSTECRKSPSVSCMDCMKDFDGSDYQKHNKCITEDQKYSGKPVDPNSSMGKGEKKQLEWVETVRQILETKGSSLTPQERELFEAMKDFENIPRKKKKFENFLKNVVRRYVNQQTVDNVWAILEEHKPVPSKTREMNGKLDSANESQENSSSAVKSADEGKEGRKSKSSKQNAKEEVTAENGEDNEDCEGEQGSRSHDKSKKKKKDRTDEIVPTVLEEEVVPEETVTKKKKKKQKNAEGEVVASEEKIVDDRAIAEAVEKEPEEEEKVAKLSKKEKKEKKKREKYDAELKSVTDDRNVALEDMDIDPSEVRDDGVKGNKSKKKKNKKGEKVEGVTKEEAVVETKKSGKKGKRKLEAEVDAGAREEKRIKGGGDKEVEENGCEVDGEEGVNVPVGENQDKPKGKFKWDKIITSVLEAVPEHELPVKRLRKKVLAEYQLSVESGNTRGQSLEEALGMFERKLHKVPGVKVMKDRAKLTVESE